MSGCLPGKRYPKNTPERMRAHTHTHMHKHVLSATVFRCTPGIICLWHQQRPKTTFSQMGHVHKILGLHFIEEKQKRVYIKTGVLYLQEMIKKPD